MKKLLSIVITSTLLLVTNAFAVETKIGVLDLQLIMEKAPQVTAINKRLNDQFDSRKKALMTEQKTFEADRDKLQKDASVMKPADLKALQQKVSDQATKLQQQSVSFQQDLVQAQNKAFQGFLNEVRTVVAQLAEKNKLTLVILKANVAYSDASYDVTEQVLDGLKKTK